MYGKNKENTSKATKLYTIEFGERQNPADKGQANMLQHCLSIARSIDNTYATYIKSELDKASISVAGWNVFSFFLLLLC